MKSFKEYGILGRGAILSGAVLAALTIPSFFRDGCHNPTAPEINLESVYVAEADSNSSDLEKIVQVIDLPSSELESWRSQYLIEGDNKLDSSELTTMAEYFFSNNAYQFTNFGPNFVPSKGEASVVDYNLDGANGAEAVIGWNGDKYTFRVSKDLTSARIYENK